jgi:hypothetical protein
MQKTMEATVVFVFTASDRLTRNIGKRYSTISPKMMKLWR